RELPGRPARIEEEAERRVADGVVDLLLDAPLLVVPRINGGLCGIPCCGIALAVRLAEEPADLRPWLRPRHVPGPLLQVLRNRLVHPLELVAGHALAVLQVD